MKSESEPNEPGVKETPLNRFSNLRYHPAHSSGGEASTTIHQPDVADSRLADRRRKKAQPTRQARRNDLDVRGPGFVSNATPLQGARPASGATAAHSPPAMEVPQDEVELSAAGQLMGKLTEGTDAALRSERLARIKAEIAKTFSGGIPEGLVR